ncbi:MAG: T9SS type A sorting domain-containing protein [Terrimonas sp.]|nr:T9SS type A sorting domain-containing protein [Terrimonas sp.]
MVFIPKKGIVFLRCRNQKIILFWKNKSKFVSLRRIIPIWSIILLLAIQSNGQSRNLPNPEGPKILKYYPNPATSFINFELQTSEEKGLNLYVINFLGKQVYEQKNIQQRTIIDLSQFTRGVYIFQLRDMNGKAIESGKFQVSK